MESLIASGQERITQLTAYFNFNKNRDSRGEPRFHLTYPKAYSKIRYDKQTKEWKEYIVKSRADTVLSRMKRVSPTNVELHVCFILFKSNFFKTIRLLLLKVEDPRGWDDLKTFNGIVYDSFVDAARARGLLKDMKLWKDTVEEAFRSIGTVQKRIRWLAMFFASTNLTEPNKMLDTILGLPDAWMAPTSLVGKSLNDRRQFVLRAMEWYLRANGVRPDEVEREDGTWESACEHIGLMRPEGINVTPDLLYDVIIIFNR